MHQSEANAKFQPASATPGKPRFEVRIDVQVDKSAKVYRDAKARMMQLGLLGDMAIDFTQGTESIWSRERRRDIRRRTHT